MYRTKSPKKKTQTPRNKNEMNIEIEMNICFLTITHPTTANRLQQAFIKVSDLAQEEDDERLTKQNKIMYQNQLMKTKNKPIKQTVLHKNSHLAND